MGALGQWVLREACRQARQWIDAGIEPRTIAVNVSSAQFKVPFELENNVLAVLTETGLPPHLLELEITETTLIGLLPEQVTMIYRLRGRGVKISLDDFGTGYSSLNYLRRFPVDQNQDRAGVYFIARDERRSSVYCKVNHRFLACVRKRGNSRGCRNPRTA